MWSHVTSIFGRFGRTALATEPCVSTDFSTATSAVPAATSPTYSPTSPPDSEVPWSVPPEAPELSPPPPTEGWIRKNRLMRESGVRYDSSLFQFDTVGYYHPPRALAHWDEDWLFNFISARIPLDLPRPPDAPRIYHLQWRQRCLKERFEFGAITKRAIP